jgi:dihydrofolate reductase
VVSRTLTGVGPNATLLGSDLEAEVRAIKTAHDGEIKVAGPTLAAALGDMGLIDEYRVYLHPVVLGRGTPYFARARPRLRLVAHDVIDSDVIRLRYVPA